jgi:hypothetical protein
MTDEKNDTKVTEAEGSPNDELAAALAHLKSAAGLLARRIDPAVRKAAQDAERAVERVASETERTANEIGAAAKPFASKVGAELGKLADEIKKSVAHLEKAGQPDAEAKKPAADPDDPSTLR